MRLVCVHVCVQKEIVAWAEGTEQLSEADLEKIRADLYAHFPALRQAASAVPTVRAASTSGELSRAPVTERSLVPFIVTSAEQDDQVSCQVAICWTCAVDVVLTQGLPCVGSRRV